MHVHVSVCVRDLHIHPANLQFQHPSGFFFVFPILYLYVKCKYSSQIFFHSEKPVNYTSILTPLPSSTAHIQWFHNFNAHNVSLFPEQGKTFMFIYLSLLKVILYVFTELTLFKKIWTVLPCKDVSRFIQPVYCILALSSFHYFYNYG